jgi:DNA repair protein RadA/Sms
MAKTKTVFYCTECGNETIKWQGRCPACGAWNSIVEHKSAPAAKASAAKNGPYLAKQECVKISKIDDAAETRFHTGFAELDRVLGGGAVEGSLVLVGGAPGIGKSTLLLQMCGFVGETMKVLYVTGEESGKQLKMRAKRLNVASDGLFVLVETNLGEIMESITSLAPDLVIIDSIQTLYNETVESSAGSQSQIKDCTMHLMQIAKTTGTTIFIVGHITKEGSIAGPKILEHMVDCVLYFEGENNAAYRILRAAKNRFGSTNEIGVFEMLDHGLAEVPNPSETLLSGRLENASGSCVTCVIEGSRPVLAEIQALITPTSFNVPRRTSSGIDYNRAALLLAVLEKRGGLKMSASDAYINVVGGLELDEPSADLATILAVASSYVDKPVGDDVVAIGEVGLTGEIRSVSFISQRIAEAFRLGFKKCIVPIGNKGKYTVPDGLTVYEVKNLRDALSCAIGAKKDK